MFKTVKRTTVPGPINPSSSALCPANDRPHRSPAHRHKVISQRAIIATLPLLILLWSLPLTATSDTDRLNVVADNNYPPYLFLNPDGKPEGYVADFWRLWTEKTGIPVDLQAMEWAKAQAVLQQGRADVIDMIYRTPEREQIYDYGPAYARLPVAIYSHASITGLSHIESLRGFQVGVMKGDACIEILKSRGIKDLEYYESYVDLIRGAIQEHVKVFCLDEYPANFYLYQLRVQKTFTKAFQLYEGEFHHAVRKGDTQTLSLIQKGIDAMSDKELNALRRKWFGNPINFQSYLQPLIVGLIGVIAIAIVMALWLLTLRNMVRRKTDELEHQRRHLQTLLQAIPDPVWLKDPKGAYLFCNPAFENLVGQPETAIKGLSDYQLLHYSQAHRCRIDNNQVVESLQQISIKEWMTPSGQTAPQLFLTTKRPVVDSRGQLVGVLGLARNIHELYEMQKALGERIKERDCLYALFRITEDLQTPLEETLQAAADMLPGGWLYPHLAAARIALYGRSYETACFSDDAPNLEAPIMIGGQPMGHVAVAYLAPLPDGGDHVFLPEEHLLLQAVAERLGSTAKRRAIEEKARQREEIFKAIFTYASDCITLMDVETLAFVEFNDAACHSLGYTRDEFAQLRLPDIQGEFDTPTIRRMLDDIMQRGSAVFETLRRCKDGTLRNARVNLQRIDLHGMRYLSNIWTDITDHVRIDAKLRRLNQIYSALAQSNEAILRCESIEALLEQVCQITVKSGGMAMAWVGLIDESKKSLRIVARHGSDLDYLDDLHISIDPDDSHSHGPTGTAIRENKPYWCSDNLADSNVLPWLQKQLQFGFRASASIPINSLGRAIGALTFYAKTPYPFDDEERALLLEMAMDIGFALDSLKSRQLLIEKEQQLRSLGDNLPDGFVYRLERSADGREKFHYISAGVEKIYGVPPEQVLADPSLLFLQMTDDSARRYAEGKADSARTLSNFQCLLQLNQPNGEYRWLRVQSHPTRKGDGSTIWDGVAIDVTEQQSVTQELDRHRHHLEELVAQRTRELNGLVQEQVAIFESASSGIVLVKDRVVQRCNRKLEDILGYPTGGLTGQSTRIWYADDASFLAAGQVYERIWLGDYASIEQELVRLDGRHIWVRMTGHAIDVNDKEKGSVWVVDDISVERQTAEALRRAKELAEEATKAKSNFLANMSHEIRTPMNAILGMLHLALKTELTTAQHNYLSKAQGAAHSLLGIINDILDFSKIEAGKLDIEHIEFSVDRVLEQLADTISYQTEQKGIEFLIRYDPSIPSVLIGDPLRLSQVLINLCSNAVKFTERGEIELSFHSLKKTETDILIQVCVRDSGIGMPPDLQGKLFQEFTQADQSTTRRFGGTGLGLAICKNLTEMMNGRIWLEDTQLGRGTTICFTVKLGVSRQAESRQRALAEQAGNLLTDVRVLVVDDNAVSREILAEMLRFFRIEVDTARNGAIAIEMLRTCEHPYELVLMDWRMPLMNGDEATRLIRQDDAISPKPRIVMVTAYCREDVILLADKAGVDGFLIKPVTPSTLLDTALSVLGRGRILSKAASEARETKSPPIHVQLAGAKILLVEDNAINREFAGELLRSEGIEVDEAENGMIAVTKIESKAFDAVLMDIQMPIMDGLEATRKIRAMASIAKTPDAKNYFEQLPIIAMTALAMTNDQENSLAAGMNGHITKPIDPDQLMAILAQWVRSDPDRTGTTLNTTGLSEPGDIPADLQALTHLTVVEGIRRIGGNPDAFRKQLLRFRKHYLNAFTELKQLLERGDLAQAELFCHTLKGVTGNLGAHRLYDKISEVDEALKQSIPPDSALLTAIEQAFQSLFDDIDRHIATDVPRISLGTSPQQKASLIDNLNNLAHALEYDFGVVDALVENTTALVAGSPYENAFSDLANDIDVFDTEAALTKLKALLDTMGDA